MTDKVQTRYSLVAMLFHWTIAIAVIWNWRIAEAAEHAGDADKAAIMVNHKALGITILILTIARLLWRWSHPVPALPEGMASWEKKLARAVHIIFYVLLIGLPIGGWLAGSFVGKGVDVWGLFTLPALPVGEDVEQAKKIIGMHETGGKFMLILIVLHIIGALKHTFIDKDGNLWRMLPFGPAK